MPKSLVIDPKTVRQKSEITFDPIPVNHYDRSIKQEIESGRFSQADLIRIFRDMTVLRTFETALNEIKLRGNYKGVEYNHRGPAHLSIGQESAAVGMAYTLDENDHIYGSHRSHGEILAKGLSSIHKLGDAKLMDIMSAFFSGDCLRVVEKDAKGDTKDLALDFLLYGAFAEIFGRENGFNKGMGGSMHAFFLPFGIYPNNAIVGGSGDISVGAAIFKKCNQQPGIVVANIGDASSACGPVWEGICLATMDQYKQLWDEPYRGGLPLILNFFNNFYGMGGQPAGETMGFGMLARLGAGINPEQMHAERVDGFNPLAVIDAFARKKEIIEKKEGPVLLDTMTYRFSGHSPSDASSYRTKEEVDAWMAQDPIKAWPAALVEAGVCSQSDVEAIWANTEEAVLKNFKKAVSLETSPRANLMVKGHLLEQTMFSNEKKPSMDTSRKAEYLLPYGEDPRSKKLATLSRSAFDANGAKLSKAKCVLFRDAIFEAVRDRFYEDPTLVAYGEENRDWGGAFAVYRGLTEALPYHRIFNSPISEGAIVGSAVGYALEGGRAIVELMYCDFLGRAGDEVFNQLSKWQSMSGGLLKMPVVLRISVGSKYGAQHSQDWSAIFAHIPGLKVVFPATPYDAKGLMNTALTGTDPVIFLESQRIYDIPEEFEKGGVPADYYEVPFGESVVRKEGKDLTILTVGAILYRALEAAKTLEEKYGISVEVIDARSIVPFDYAPVLASVRKTRKILLASDACERGNFLHTVASNISKFAFDELDAPPTVLGSRNIITPADEVEEAFFPYPNDFLDAIHEHILPLKGYTLQRDATIQDQMDRAKIGL